jgi:hypothetical protein
MWNGDVAPGKIMQAWPHYLFGGFSRLRAAAHR